ncbi:hypothetical protein Nepgr_018549 [Nepenthes gracilis]|uniref:Uncharacterized protein n=1 Tax=Nepenthes gracilis TaxID=150966 RepID=A0AAD3XTI2_NEPGR|nr:hypothetical protein Nepgr_018549 [Nepenthes gracilis]
MEIIGSERTDIMALKSIEPKLRLATGQVRSAPKMEAEPLPLLPKTGEKPVNVTEDILLQSLPQEQNSSNPRFLKIPQTSKNKIPKTMIMSQMI